MSGIIKADSKTVFTHPEGYYILKREHWKFSEEDTNSTRMLAAYSTIDGSYIGDRRFAKYLRKRGIKAQCISSEGHISSIGFCEKENKWYGWSHRAIFGFGIGSTVKKGNCAYTPATVEELYAEATEPEEDGYQNHKPEYVTKLEDGIRIEHPCTKFLSFDDIEAIEDEELKVKYKSQYSNKNNKSYDEAKVEYDKRKEEIRLAREKEIPSAEENKVIAEEGYLNNFNGLWVPAESQFYDVKVGRGEWTAQTMEDAKQMAIDFARSVS